MKAALRWLHTMQTEDVHRTRALFTSHESFSDLTPGQYDDGLAWLRRIGLAPSRRRPAQSVTELRLLCLQLLERSLETACPDWIAEIHSAPSASTPLPPAGQRLAASLGLRDSDMTAAVSKAWIAERARVGAAGERALLALLNLTVKADVIHVSAISDRFGYDISVESGGSTAHLEVKSTAGAGRAPVIFLSRHEYETMHADPAWHLVFAVLDREDQLTSVSSINRDWITEVAPSDGHTDASQWASARLTVPSAALIPGIPAIWPWLRPDAPGPRPGMDHSSRLLVSGRTTGS
ncbi:protein NO VEIN domain-containing protein [Kitasatospora sp. NPDC051170]|uniref:protein NO VEIN domain-containing protein n=1 Tax=Kitasatospora sp. NPDC051170 TaxID=3364056 RepID=UPI0037AE337C